MALLVQYNEGGAGIKLAFEQQRTHIGRDEKNEVSLDDELVSKVHAVVEVIVDPENDEVNFYIQDLKSTNHTFVNDQPIDIHKLRDGDNIRIGMTNFRFIEELDNEPAETAKLYKSWIPGVFYTGKKK